MCGAAAGGIGAVAGLVGPIFQLIAAKQQQEAQRKAALYNAAVARNNATAESQKGASEVEKRREEGRELMAKQRAAYGASGVLVDAGTPLTVFGETQTDTNMDVASAQYDARVKAQNQIAQQQLHLFTARAAGSSLL